MKRKRGRMKNSTNRRKCKEEALPLLIEFRKDKFFFNHEIHIFQSISYITKVLQGLHLGS